jgi:cyclohexa-1,5-dienecarbonyl-CoA hydratase
MAELKNLKLASSEGIARLTLDRPKHNVLNIEMMRAVNRVIEALAADPTLKCLVISGEGQSFCAGVDVGEHKPEMVHEMIAVFGRIFELLDRFQVPTIAAVQGACLGGGMELAIACDMVIASHNAKFSQPEIKLGFLPPYAAIRLPQLIGPAKAIEVCTTGKVYTADQAARLGFVTQVAPADQLDAAVDQIVAELAANSPLIIRLNKQAVTTHLGLPFSQALAGVNDLFLNTLMKTEDTLEGIASFEEKRKPQWKNK